MSDIELGWTILTILIPMALLAIGTMMRGGLASSSH